MLATIYLLISHIRLRRRVGRLDGELAELKVRRAAPPEIHDAKPESDARVSVAADAPAKEAIDESDPEAAPIQDGQKAGPWDLAAKTAAAESDATVRTSPPSPPPAAQEPPARYVLSPDLISRAFAWAQVNWFYLVAAVSLGLAGVFLVQYGIEQGLLSPGLRVLAALGLGIALIGAGEFLRRRGGDDADELFAYLPSTFAAGGLISMFSGILAARMLYGLIEAGPALALLAAIGVLAMAIGWLYGPLLAAIGILGAIAAPFVVGADSDAADLLHYYFAVIVVVAMLVDTIKRWAWLSGYALLLGFAAAANLFMAAPEGLHFIGFALIATIAAVIIPERSLAPTHQGRMVLEALISRTRLTRALDDNETGPTAFPTRLAAGVFAAATAIPLWVHAVEFGTFWLALAALIALALLSMIWMRLARALHDLALLPVLAIPALILNEAYFGGTVHNNWMAAFDRVAEDPAPRTIMALVGIGLAISLIAAWRSYLNAPYRMIWAFGAAAFAPVIALFLELEWAPAAIIGDAGWAYHVIAVAGVMVVLAERFARRDGEDKRRAALFTLAALTMLSMALVLMLSASALTLALAVMTVLAAALDKRFVMPALRIFVAIGAMVRFFRLVIDPGLVWAYDAPFWDFFLTYLAVLLMFTATWMMLAGGDRRLTCSIVDTVLWSLTGVFASLLLVRLIETYAPGHEESHATVSLIGLVWLISAANQLKRLKDRDVLRWLRIVLAGIYGLIGLMALLAAVTVINPLMNGYEPVFGPYLLDSLFVAFALPGLLMLLVAARFDHLKRWLRHGIGALGVLLTGLYAGLEIRRLWRGNDLAVHGTTDGELYTYTVALLLVSTSLLFYAFYRHSPWLRKLALAGIGLTVAKVFLIDVSGLTGLTRVFSFLVLGLAVAGLAWLDRWFGAREGNRKADEKAN